MNGAPDQDYWLVVIYYAFYLDVAQGRMNGAPDEEHWVVDFFYIHFF